MLRNFKVSSVLPFMSSKQLKQQNKSKKQSKKSNGQSRRKAGGSSIPLAKSYSKPYKQPKFVSKGANVVVTHREFVGDMESDGSAFYLDAVRVNAANANMFPWLSGVASHYESYKFKRLVFEYVPTCSATTGGSVVMMLDYDAADASPVDKAEMLTAKCKASGRIWDGVRLSASESDEKTLGTQRFTLPEDGSGNSVTYPPNTASQTYDLGYFNIALISGAGIYGELFVDYVVELITPQKSELKITSGELLGDPETTDKNHPFGEEPARIGNAFANAALSYVNNIAYVAMPRSFHGLANIIASGTGLGANITYVDHNHVAIPGLTIKNVITAAAGLTQQVTSMLDYTNNTVYDTFMKFDMTPSTTLTGLKLFLSPYDSVLQ